MNYYIFRIQTNDSFKREELKAGNLRQGWGVQGLHLIEEDGSYVEMEAWRERFTKVWDEDREKIKRRYQNLSNMREMGEGDVVLIPKFPEWNSLTIAKIKKGYTFDLKREDFGHKLEIDLETLRQFKYNSNEHSKLIQSKFRAYQSPVNNVKNREVRKSMEALLSMESSEELKNVSDIIKGKFFNNVTQLKKELNEVLASDIEKLAEDIFVNAGYTLVKRNTYDKKGGDADLIFQKDLEIISELSTTDIDHLLYVQVKKKVGDTWNEMEGVEQLRKITKDEARNYTKVLVSTAEFSNATREIASEEGIVLIGGGDLIKLIIKYL